MVIKPAEQTPATSALLRRLAEELFRPDEVLVLEGGKDVATALLRLPWDHIFFTGSPEVGKVVMRAAAEHLSGVTLELGGKSPAVVDATADLRDAAEKIVWGKFLNAGQTCVAPDYLLVQRAVQAPLLEELKAAIGRYYNPAGAGIKASDSYARVVNAHHFQRLAALLEDAETRGATVAAGGALDAAQRYLEPTILTDVPAGAAVLEEEIFGPLLPVLAFDELSETADYINARPKPLAQYVFTTSAANRRYLLGNISAGGAAVNETHPAPGPPRPALRRRGQLRRGQGPRARRLPGLQQRERGAHAARGPHRHQGHVPALHQPGEAAHWLAGGVFVGPRGRYL